MECITNLSSACISETSSQSLTPSDDPTSFHRACYTARSHLALFPPDTSSAQSILQPFLSLPTPPPSAKAITLFADYLTGRDASKVEEIRDLVLELEGNANEEDGDVRVEEGVVRVIAGTVFILEGEVEEAVATLTEGAGKTDLEWSVTSHSFTARNKLMQGNSMAVLVQLLLSLDRKDLAESTYTSAKKIGNDSTIIQAMEAWIGLKTVSSLILCRGELIRERYQGGRQLQQSYYYFEELYQLPSGRTGPVLASHAAAHYLQGHVDEAKADVSEGLERDGGDKDGDVLAVGATLGMPGLSA
jgi:coatomer protein complex subunit epsilon